jgi:hypothetical protein
MSKSSVPEITTGGGVDGGRWCLGAKEGVEVAVTIGVEEEGLGG